MANRSVEQQPRRVHQEIPDISEAALLELVDALVERRSTAGSIRLVYRIAREYGRSRQMLSRKALMQLALLDSSTLEISINRAEADGFILVDRDTTPQTFQIAPEYHALAASSA